MNGDGTLDWRRERVLTAPCGAFYNIGDGQLNYSPERIFETYYSWKLNDWSALTFDYQFITNPAYNADRGPVSIVSGRLHAEF